MTKSVMPPEWSPAVVSDLAELIRGVTYKKGQARDVSGDALLPVLRANNIEAGNLNFEKLVYVPAELVKPAQKIKSGDIVVAMSSGSKSVVGKAAPARQDIEGGFGAFCGVLRPRNGVYAGYIAWFSQSLAYRNRVSELSAGANINNLKPSHFDEIAIPVAPWHEQKAIADKLDTLLAQVENTKARLDRIPQILKRFRQSVLAAAVSGKLTEEWRQNNQVTPVDESLADIARCRAKIVRSRNKESQSHLVGEEYSIPDTWRWVSLDALAGQIVDGAHHTPKYVDTGVPFLSVKDIRDGEIDFSDSKYISAEQHAELSKRCSPALGDLLITKSGTIGRTAIVKGSREFSLFVSVALIKPASSLVDMKYIDIALQKWVNEIDVSSRIVGTAVKNLHLQDMRVLAIPFAPIEEQAEIVRRVGELIEVVNGVEEKVAEATNRVNNLTQSVLAKAFRGELTKQWREDNSVLINGENSAEALLEKIQAEKASVKPVKRSRRKTA